MEDWKWIEGVWLLTEVECGWIFGSWRQPEAPVDTLWLD